MVPAGPLILRRSVIVLPGKKKWPVGELEPLGGCCREKKKNGIEISRGQLLTVGQRRETGSSRC